MSDDDILEGARVKGGDASVDRELGGALDDLEALLKNGDVVSALTARGINASLALVAASGLRAYLTGDKTTAHEDFATVAEEIHRREELGAEERRRGRQGSGQEN